MTEYLQITDHGEVIVDLYTDDLEEETDPRGLEIVLSVTGVGDDLELSENATVWLSADQAELLAAALNSAAAEVRS